MKVNKIKVDLAKWKAGQRLEYPPGSKYNFSKKISLTSRVK